MATRTELLADLTGGRPLKVINFIARLNIGGPAIHVSLLTQQLGPPLFESHLVAGRVPASEGDMAYFAESCGVTPEYLDSLSPELSPRTLTAFVDTVRLLRRERPDVLHTHTAMAGFIGRFAARLVGIPVVVHTFHGHVLRGYFGRFKTGVFRTLERLAARSCDCVLAVSETVRTELLELGVGRPERFRVMELGMGLQRFADAAPGALRAELGLGPATPLLGTSGRLVDIKNQSLLLRAAAQLRVNLPELQVVLIGDGELRHVLQREAAELGLGGAVHFLGWRVDLAPMLADLDVFALTSRNEGTPISLIEAAAAGRPLVATAVGGVPDLVTAGETGWLVPDDDADALASALGEAFGDRAEAARRGAAAQALCLERFSVGRLCEAMTALYFELLDTPRARRLLQRRG